MASLVRKYYRKLRYGRPIVVVSGLPRSGTSMMMQMLEAGGLEILSDKRREADESNPRGYYELERVKELEKGGDRSWLVDARGKAVKIVSHFLPFLPESNNYEVLFVQRDLGEILASQAKMLAARGEASDTDDARMRELFAEHLVKAGRVLAARRCFDVLEVAHHDVISNPAAIARRVSRFLDEHLDEAAMVRAVDPMLYRSRGP